METLPCALYILMHHGHEPEEAIVRAVNDTKDNDTVAAIVGAAVGALHGAKALPERWRANLTGRTLAGGKREGEDVDDRRIFELIDQARAGASGLADMTTSTAPLGSAQPKPFKEETIDESGTSGTEEHSQDKPGRGRRERGLD